MLPCLALASTQILPLKSGPTSGTPGFHLIPASETGIRFTNALPASDAARNQILLNGSGVAAGDVDADGWVDLYFCALRTGNRLYRNLGQGRFADVTDVSGTGRPGRSSTGAAFADVDGDGDLDLLVNAIGAGTELLENDGTGRFTEKKDSGLVPRFGATSLALSDIDRDGDLDLYVANYRTNTIRSSGFAVLNVNGRRMVRPEDRERLEYLPDGRILEHGEPDILYRNLGRGRFAPVPWTEGAFLDQDGKPLTRAPFDWSLSAAFCDLNDDGAPDLYVCGDFHSPDHLWLNDGTGRFRAAPSWVQRNSPTFSMAVDFADLDRDGHFDFLVADMLDPRHEFRIAQSTGWMSIPGDFETTEFRPQLGRNALQRNRGDGTFAELAYAAGLEASGWTWSVLFLDVDLDGYEDLLAATGHQFDTQDQDAQERIDAAGPYRQDQIPGKLFGYPPLLTRMMAYRNLGQLRFQELGDVWISPNPPGVWQGMALADLDNDGDTDVVVNRLNDGAAILRNDGTAPRVAVRLKGRAPNTRGIGARLELHGGPVPLQAQTLVAGGRYLSGDEALRVFAAGRDPANLRLEVRWPSGLRSVIPEVRPNHLYIVDESDLPAAPPAKSPPPAQPTNALPKPLFVDESARLGHRHYEAPFDDFERQPLLPRRYSRVGPGVGWIDLDGDGRDDLFVSGGKGGRPGIFLNSGQGRFRLVESDPARHDQVGVVASHPERGPSRALVAISPYETPSGKDPMSLVSYGPDGNAEPCLPPGSAHSGPLALADFDADGDLDLWVGGGTIGGRFPESTPSHLWERHEGNWRPSEGHDPELARVRSANGAVWADLDADGFPELVVACEWGPIRVFHNRRGRFSEITRDLGLDRFVGWWTGLEAADFDGDGRLDLVAGNWGLNSTYRATAEHPVRLHFGDLAGWGQVDLIESAYEPSLDAWAPRRDLTVMSKTFPWLREKFPGHHLYGRARLDDLLPHLAGPFQVLEANTLATTVFLQRGSRFEPAPLPDEAQHAPVHGVTAADFDLDGHLDLFLAQNFFAVSPAVSRLDAGRGLLLLGDGRGRFRPLEAAASGIAVYGEQRGSAWSDYDEDGRPDLVVTQNAAETRLFRNNTSRPGWRVRLRGPRGNPHAIGASVRLRVPPDPAGPTRTLPAGSGYRSQSGSVLCFPRPDRDAILEIRWPGGTSSSHPVPFEQTSAPTTIEFPGHRTP